MVTMIFFWGKKEREKEEKDMRGKIRGKRREEKDTRGKTRGRRFEEKEEE